MRTSCVRPTPLTKSRQAQESSLLLDIRRENDCEAFDLQHESVAKTALKHSHYIMMLTRFRLSEPASVMMAYK